MKKKKDRFFFDLDKLKPWIIHGEGRCNLTLASKIALSCSFSLNDNDN